MRTILSIDKEKEVIVQKAWLESLKNIAYMVERKPDELQVLLGYISSVDMCIKVGEINN